MSDKFTVTYELKSNDSEIHKKIMESFAKNLDGKEVGGVAVFAITNGDLHKQIEDIEECVDESEQEDLAYDLEQILSKRY